MPNDMPGGGTDRNKESQQSDVTPLRVDNGMAALGELICRLNPYTELPKDSATGLETDEMQVGMLPRAGGDYKSDDHTDTIACMGVEVQHNYGEKWSFKGQPHTVKTMFRVPYRFLVKKNGIPHYWQTEYLLVGYAGADGGG